VIPQGPLVNNGLPPSEAPHGASLIGVIYIILYIIIKESIKKILYSIIKIHKIIYFLFLIIQFIKKSSKKYVFFSKSFVPLLSNDLRKWHLFVQKKKSDFFKNQNLDFAKKWHFKRYF